MSTPTRTISRRWYQRLRPVLQPGHEVALLEGGREFFPALEEAVASARREVLLETYIFEDDASGRRVATALAQAAQRGVRVRVVVDGFGCREMTGEVHETLCASPVIVEIFRPEKRRFALDRQRLRRLHRKLCVVDGRIAFVGGINILDDFYDPNYGKLEEPRLDFAVRVRGPLVTTAHLAMHRLWSELALVNRPLRTLRSGVERRTLFEPVTSEEQPAGRLRAALVLRDNFRFRGTIERRYLRAIRRARREILIANAYFLPGVRFRRALLRAAERGVKVRLLLQGRVEYRLQHYASQALYDELLRAGIEIVEYRKSFLHAKVAVIDDWATVGSSNIDPFSLLLAREANVVVIDRAFAARLRERLLAAMAEGGQPVALTHYMKRSLPVRVMHWVAFGLLRLGVALTGAAGKY